MKIKIERVTLLNTGLNSMTGGRIKRFKEYIEIDLLCLHMEMELVM